ncbi:sensor histidine kinase [Brevundimonas sp. S30B]|uniref:sensor histidine kinase n=1 Tax=unclassified Brevundimonas TaxID=2622653 RepID=UPI0010727FB0|nr:MULTISPECIES: sensor histidine kinase [unclassified Brevundimonas]QBX37382.1 sensor histidine kinase [Brevundimonas sp. MF30-B]TFW03825.1 sensor histidine kinase [Brevundimonas sp. S30B]
MAPDVHTDVSDLKLRLAGNYQLLQALVGIRLRAVSDPESRRHLTWLSDVVAALGLLNRRLLAGGAVDVAGYLEDAIAFWRRAVHDRPVRLELRGDVGALPETHATPLAIILHELLSNAVRHAFPDGGRGAVAVAASRAADGISLVVRDTGVGAESGVTGEGLALVRGLIEHLGGSLVLETAPGQGFAARVRLPLAPTSRH